MENRIPRVRDRHTRTGSQRGYSGAGGVQECSSRFRVCLSDLVSYFLLCTPVTCLPNGDRAHEQPGQGLGNTPLATYWCHSTSTKYSEQTGLTLGWPEAPSDLALHFLAKRISPQAKEEKQAAYWVALLNMLTTDGEKEQEVSFTSSIISRGYLISIFC